MPAEKIYYLISSRCSECGTAIREAGSSIKHSERCAWCGGAMILACVSLNIL